MMGGNVWKHHSGYPGKLLNLSFWFFHFYPVDLCNSIRSNFCDLQFISLCLLHCPCLCPVCDYALRLSCMPFPWSPCSFFCQYTMHSVIEFRACAWESYNLLWSKFSIQYRIYYGQIMQTAQLQSWACGRISWVCQCHQSRSSRLVIVIITGGTTERY